jgi:hypoxanthine phosphoribosyltransferase
VNRLAIIHEAARQANEFLKKKWPDYYIAQDHRQHWCLFHHKITPADFSIKLGFDFSEGRIENDITWSSHTVQYKIDNPIETRY